VIRAIVDAHGDEPSDGNDALGLVLTGGYRPEPPVIEAIRRAKHAGLAMRATGASAAAAPISRGAGCAPAAGVVSTP
jgi:BioD-like phosphotransacetylase family protein